MSNMQTVVAVASSGLMLAGVLIAAGIAKPVILKGLSWVNAEASSAIEEGADAGVF